MCEVWVGGVDDGESVVWEWIEEVERCCAERDGRCDWDCEDVGSGGIVPG